MNTEFKKMALCNRIDRLKANGKENGRIIQKLERKLRSLNK